MYCYFVEQLTEEELLHKKIPVAYIVYDPHASSTGSDNDTIDASGATDEEKLIEKFLVTNNLWGV